MALAAGRGRAKRVTGPLDDKAKARLRGDDYRLAGYASNSSSSGSEHEGCDLSGFLDVFFFSKHEEDAGAEEGREGEDLDAVSPGSDGEGGRSGSPLPDPVPVVAMVRDLLKTSAGDRFRRDLVSNVADAVESLAGLRSDRSAFRRAVMISLRESGYNAGICKAKWESRGGITAGSHEYIDVVRPPPDEAAPSQQQRYIVDVEFAAEFEIARPTGEYVRVAAELPRAYVGKPEELKRMLRLLADAAKRSLRSRELHVPPWRKSRYVQAKWLGPYRRTVNPVPSAPRAPLPPPCTVGREVKCRCVGFEPGNNQLTLPPATRTR